LPEGYEVEFIKKLPAAEWSDRQLFEMGYNLSTLIEIHRRLSKDYELKVQTSEAFIDLAAIRTHAQTARPEVKLLKHPLKISVRDYLGSVLPGLSDFPISRIAELDARRLGGPKLTDQIRRRHPP
jgi:hypothetical protein